MKKNLSHRTNCWMILMAFENIVDLCFVLVRPLVRAKLSLFLTVAAKDPWICFNYKYKPDIYIPVRIGLTFHKLICLLV